MAEDDRVTTVGINIEYTNKEKRVTDLGMMIEYRNAERRVSTMAIMIEYYTGTAPVAGTYGPAMQFMG